MFLDLCTYKVLPPPTTPEAVEWKYGKNAGRNRCLRILLTTRQVHDMLLQNDHDLYQKAGGGVTVAIKDLTSPEHPIWLVQRAGLKKLKYEDIHADVVHFHIFELSAKIFEVMERIKMHQIPRGRHSLK